MKTVSKVFFPPRQKKTRKNSRTQLDSITLQRCSGDALERRTIVNNVKIVNSFEIPTSWEEMNERPRIIDHEIDSTCWTKVRERDNSTNSCPFQSSSFGRSVDIFYNVFVTWERKGSVRWKRVLEIFHLANVQGSEKYSLILRDLLCSNGFSRYVKLHNS